MTRRTIFINDSTWTRLLALADSTGYRVSELVRRALIEFLERMEKKDERGESL
jgi:predicted transcriptional regulator